MARRDSPGRVDPATVLAAEPAIQPAMPDDPQLDALKLPPHSLEAEQSVLGGLLLDNDAADRVGDVASPEDFYSDADNRLYQTVDISTTDAAAGNGFENVHRSE